MWSLEDVERPRLIATAIQTVYIMVNKYLLDSNSVFHYGVETTFCGKTVNIVCTVLEVLSPLEVGNSHVF